jgi:glycosyltransferase involved in cell wall biosynthesis
VEITVHRLANALTRIGNAVTVYSATPAPDERAYTHERLFPDRPSTHKNRLVRLFLLPGLLNGIPFEDHDVLHLHGDDWFFVSRSTPTVRTFHGSAWEEAQSADSWTRRLEQYCIYPLEQLSDQISTLSAAVGPNTADIYDTPHLVDNGVDLNRFHPGAKTPFPSVLFVGTWGGRKRGRFLFKTFVHEVLPHVPDARLYMVADDCPAHDQVELVSRPSDEELAALYRKAWVFAHPSVYEGFGIPYAEAMASGTAVLCSPNDGARYVLDDYTFGVVSKDETFGRNLIRLLRDDEHRRAVAKDGLERSKAFSWTEVARQHETLYRRAVDTTP